MPDGPRSGCLSQNSFLPIERRFRRWPDVGAVDAMSPLREIPSFRFAMITDAPAIASLMKAGTSPAIHRVTVIGSPLLAVHVARQIQASGSDQYLVAIQAGEVVGMTAWGHSGDTLMLNHIFLRTDCRGVRVGAQLVLEGLRRCRKAGEQHVGVDVFAENPRAEAWYRTLGMRHQCEKIWLGLPLCTTSSDGFGDWQTEGLSVADHAQEEMGFSRFSLRTPRTTYTIGRLGSEWYRYGGFDILDDPSAVHALQTLDPSRRLLCIGDANLVPAQWAHHGQVVSRSTRLSASVDAMFATLIARVQSAQVS
jgi:GNAT superfamily N-acetyltransferase